MRNAQAAKKSRPLIAPVSKTVTSAGPVTMPLKLNAEGKRLLKRKKTPAVSLQTTFTGPGGQPITNTARVTLTLPPPKPCKSPRKVSCSSPRTR
jgi:hypothetical protein